MRSGFTPIGNDTYSFSGKFYGNGHKIKNIFINTTDNYAGLFGVIEGAEIDNVEITGRIMITTNSGYIGGIAGYIKRRCYKKL